MTITFTRSRWYQPGPRGVAIDLVVLHTTEGGHNAQDVADFCQNRSDKVSAHFFVDNNSIVQGVKVADIAYAAPGANRNGIQIEQVGFAAYTEADWLGPHLGTLCNTARLLAHCFRRYQIPITPVDPQGLAAGHRGVTTHKWVNDAFHDSTHTDPGPGYPLDKVIQLGWHFALTNTEPDLAEAA